ncbi:hypothetical protein [Paraburkholderia youngii]|uniref:hypothetical protein n=1 Tax=Paraburkholderia youngii TaxID=2782701 RepID=UPI003D1C5BB8
MIFTDTIDPQSGLRCDCERRMTDADSAEEKITQIAQIIERGGLAPEKIRLIAAIVNAPGAPASTGTGDALADSADAQRRLFVDGEVRAAQRMRDEAREAWISKSRHAAKFVDAAGMPDVDAARDAYRRQLSQKLTPQPRRRRPYQRRAAGSKRTV